MRQRGLSGITLGLLFVALLAPASAGAATITPTTTIDDNGAIAGCSLREAVQSANQDSDSPGCTHTGTYGADTIQLGPDPYTLAIGPPDGVGPASDFIGDLDETGTLTIQGAGPDKTVISAPTGDRVIDSYGALNLIGVRIVGGNGAEDGGGIRGNAGPITLTNSVVSGNKGAKGGGISVMTVATLTDSTVRDNIATSDGGGLSAPSGGFMLTNSTVSGNTSGGKGGGISGSVTLTGSTISGNTAATDGGGLDGSGTITDSTIAGNTASNGNGGGIAGPFNTLTITRSTISGNKTMGTFKQGGGIY
jgi:CSLREA domain-containing protein